jgi:ribosomal protein S18 acetylase RimI-like enzyme
MRISKPSMIPRTEVNAAGSQFWSHQAQFHLVTQREFWRAQVNCYSARHGPLWLIRQCFSPQPNLAFNRDADTEHRFAIATRAPVNLGVRPQRRNTVPIFERALASDIPALSELLSVLFTQEVEFKPDTAAQCKGLSTIISNPDLGAILVAREGRTVLAMVNLLFTISTAIGERVALLEDMVVSPSARGSGIGSDLLNYAIDFASSSGVKRITLLTDHENTSAQRFYAKHGFSKSTMVPLRRTIS